MGGGGAGGVCVDQIEPRGNVDNKLPDHQDAEALAESFKVFFNDKVGKIR